MLIYSLLHLTGYKSVSRDDIRNFRQLGAKTPGHPENFVTAGVETTTGPLGQGIATAVGMIIFLKLILKQGEDSDALLHNFLIFQMRLTALVLGFQALILSMSTVAERRTLLFVFVSVIVFITAVWFLASVIRLLPLSKQPDDVVAFRTAQLPGSKFQRLYFIFASLLPSGMVYYAGNLTAALVFYIILLLAGHIFLYRD